MTTPALKNSDTKVLADKIAQGIATREERGITLKTLDTQLAVDLVTGLEDVRLYVDKLKTLKSKMRDKFIAKVEEDMELDNIDAETLFKYLNTLTNSELALIDTYRKLIQGGQLFNEDSMSENERTILRILRSLSTNEQRKNFFDACAQYMVQNNIDYQDASIVE